MGVVLGRRRKIDAKELALRAGEALTSKQGENIRILNMAGVSDLMDYCVLVSGGSPPHLKALTEAAQQSLKALAVKSYRRSGDPESGWMILDYVDVVVHVFTPAAREFYAIESLWSEAQEMPLPQEA